MKLVITDKQYLEDELFGYWLLERVKYELIRKVSDNRVALLETQYKELPVMQILEDSIQSLVVVHSSKKLVIQIPPTESFRKTSYKLAQLCRVINYGCLDVKHYPIFTDVFSSVTTNVQSYYTRYEEEMLAYVY